MFVYRHCLSLCLRLFLLFFIFLYFSRPQLVCFVLVLSIYLTDIFDCVSILSSPLTIVHHSILSYRQYFAVPFVNIIIILSVSSSNDLKPLVYFIHIYIHLHLHQQFHMYLFICVFFPQILF